MKVKGIVSTILIIFIVASAVTLLVRGAGDDSEVTNETGSSADSVAQENEASPAVTTQAPHAIIAYYFHGNFRCATCRKIEAFSKEAIEAQFSKQLETGKLVWRPVNVDETPNKHFMHDYDLTTRSLVLSEVNGGKEIKWKNLDKVWDLVGDREKFFEYVQDETATYLETI